MQAAGACLILDPVEAASLDRTMQHGDCARAKSGRWSILARRRDLCDHAKCARQLGVDRFRCWDGMGLETHGPSYKRNDNQRGANGGGPGHATDEAKEIPACHTSAARRFMCQNARFQALPGVDGLQDMFPSHQIVSGPRVTIRAPRSLDHNSPTTRPERV